MSYRGYHFLAIALFCMRVHVLLLLRLMVSRRATHYIHVHPVNHGHLSAILELRTCHCLFHLNKYDMDIFHCKI